MIVPGILHSQRIEDLFLEHLLIRLARHLLDNRSQKKVAGIVVNEFTAGLERQVVTGVFRDKVVDGEWVPADVVHEAGHAGVTGNSRSVIQEMVNSNLLANVLA